MERRGGISDTTVWGETCLHDEMYVISQRGHLVFLWRMAQISSVKWSQKF